MAIGAQQPQVLDPVVAAIAVHVIEMEGQRLSPPIGNAADGALVDQASLAQQAKLQAMRAQRRWANNE